MTWTAAVLPPLAALGLLSVLLPAGLFRLGRPSYPHLLRVAVISVVALILGSAAIYGWAYRTAGGEVAAALSARPGAAAGLLLRRSLPAALVWAPLLALTLLALARRVEAARTEALKARQAASAAPRARLRDGRG